MTRGTTAQGKKVSSTMVERAMDEGQEGKEVSS